MIRQGHPTKQVAMTSKWAAVFSESACDQSCHKATLSCCPACGDVLYCHGLASLPSLHRRLLLHQLPVVQFHLDLGACLG